MSIRNRIFELGRGPWTTFDPFLFCVHHLDRYPAENSNLAPDPSLLRGRQIGSDFSYKDGWSMYHGEEVPGFPSHPHRGFETITVTLQGFVDHADSLGCGARYGVGDTQWMTAGAGIQHSEMFPLLNHDKPNTMELFQIWLNLPAKNKMVKPHFTMFWAEQTPIIREPTPTGETVVRVIAGKYKDVSALPPPPDSWAADPNSDVTILIVSLPRGAAVELPPAASAKSKRAVYYYEGAQPVVVDGTELTVRQGVELSSANRPTRIEASSSASQPTNVLVLQGASIGEPVAQYGPFVMNTQAEIQRAFADYQKTQFGGWPWPTSDVVHPRDAGRFAKHPDGRTERPPASQ